MMRGLGEFLLTLLFQALIGSVLGDPSNLVWNGDFESQLVFGQDSEIDVSATNIMTYIPYMMVLHGGVQILSGFTYHPAVPLTRQYSSFSLHMNYWNGPGVLQTTVLTTPRKGAPYSVNFLMADNPNGGPLFKTLRVSNIVNCRLASPQPMTFTVSNPYTSRVSLEWITMGYNLVGTGEQTKLQFESLTRGVYGPIIDNVTVTLQSLVENGSFENVSSSLVVSNITDVTVVESPSSEIYGWTVKSGKIKYCSTFQWEGSTDFSTYLLDLNADNVAGTISSDPFATKPGKKYKVLFDTAANPDDLIPKLKGNILASAYSYPKSALLASRSIMVSGVGFSPSNIGWLTYELEFEAKESLSFIEFESKITGYNGPLLDNIAVFEVSKPGRYKSLGATFTAQTVGAGSGSPTALKPYLWTNCVTFAVVMCVLRHFVAEILLLHS